MKQQQETQLQLQQQQSADKAEELRVKEEDSIRDSNTAIEVALIGAESKQVSDNSGDKEFIDKMKLGLQEDKQNREISLKEKQLSEQSRQAKVAEDQKNKEIAIKRKQANKLTSVSNK